MLKMSDTSIGKFLPYFAKIGLPIAFLVPTETGYYKSIMDATLPIRELLKEAGVHDYEKQKQGPEYKCTVTTQFLYSDKMIETKASLYRPVTKQGDPRIWFYNLKNYCVPCNLLALMINKGVIYVINLSVEEIVESLNEGFIRELLQQFVNDENAIAMELLDKIQKIHNQGFLPSITTGDPGVGDTLENALGISRNPSKLPDYKGIELKATRMKTDRNSKTNNRVNLFTQVPDWENSKGMNRVKLLDEYGYWKEAKDGTQRFDLNCTLKAHIPNPQGLYLEVDVERDLLINYYSKNDVIARYVAQWNFMLLKQRLLEKHHETFWVKAVSQMEDGLEYFRYDKIVHTKNPNASLFPQLIDEGIITVDYIMHRKPSGVVRDHGFPFKINPKKIELLFPEPKVYEL
ncbi:MAG: MvaI/BcnI family restriction endonuclease [Eubacteriales bacterium]